MPDFTAERYGVDILDAEVVETLEFLDDWEDRYRYIIDLGKSLAGIPEADRSDESLVRGCQSQVWLLANRDDDGTMHFLVDSDAHIVRGLAAIVLAKLNQRPAADVADADMNAYFDQIGLMQHISPTRGNGLRSLVARMQQAAA